ncbi:hypothetical protein [Streptomyces liliifuscus]|uniref:hypothetical protein n=1 Tax=Streptomyces liliifuscus TaxID=2797636 RepID=UPI001F384003
MPDDPAARERRRRQVLAGAYPLLRTDGAESWVLDQVFPAERHSILHAALDLTD